MSELLIATDARTNEAPDILTLKKLGIRASRRDKPSEGRAGQGRGDRPSEEGEGRRLHSVVLA